MRVYIFEDVDDEWEKLGIDDSLDLVGIAGGDVGDGPGCLLLDVQLGVVQQLLEHWQSLAVNHVLKPWSTRLFIILEKIQNIHEHLFF